MRPGPRFSSTTSCSTKHRNACPEIHLVCDTENTTRGTPLAVGPTFEGTDAGITNTEPDLSKVALTRVDLSTQ
jgi:hypothetical protein